MASLSPMSDPVDELHSLFGPSLFPRTVRALTDAAMPSEPNDLDSVHHFMKSVTLSSPEKLLDQAKAIVDGGSDLLNFEFAKFAESIRIDKDAIAPEGKQKPQERRPGLGLGRQRARFSFKPNTSMPSDTLESILDIDQLADPEEFFAAFERAENAKRVIQRQMGGTIDNSEMNGTSTDVCHPRPGLLRPRKSVSYKHRYSSLPSESDDKLISSQDTVELDLQGAPSDKSHRDTADADIETQETDVAGSLTKAENRVNEILDELLSRSSKDLDGDGALSLLQERLKIKPIDVGELSLPDFHDIGRAAFMTLGEKLPNARKTSSNMLEVLRGEPSTMHKKEAENSISPLASPTPPKSQFGSISLLKNRHSQSISFRDPFTPLNVDLSEPRYVYSIENTDRQSDQVPVLKESSIFDKFESNEETEIGRPTVSNMKQHTGLPRASESHIDHCLDKNLGRQSIDVDVRPRGSQVDLADHGSGDEVLENSDKCNTTRGPESNDLKNEPEKQNKNVRYRSEPVLPTVQTNPQADGSTQVGSDTGVYMLRSSEVEGMPSAAAVHECVDVNMHNLPMVKNLNGSQPLLDQLSPAATKDNPVVIPSTAAETNRMKKSEKQKATKKGIAKRPRGESREMKALSRRKSIAEAGSSFDSGVRRSKRIKTRPLEYWKGERFLYGRVNEIAGLKLIGMKYISPAKADGKLKLKSFVSNDYNQILEVAARH